MAIPRNKRQRRARIVTLIVSVSVALSLLFAATGAHASTTDEVWDNGFVRVTAYANPAMTQMQVGVPTSWELSIEPLTAGTGALAVGFGLASDPALAVGLDIQVDACTVRWVGSSCPGTSALWVPNTALSTAFSSIDLEGVAHQVASLTLSTQATPTWLLVRVTPTPTLVGSALARMTLAVSGQGAPIVATPNSGGVSLAHTGVNLPWMITLLATLGIAGIILIVLNRRARQRHTRSLSVAPEEGSR